MRTMVLAVIFAAGTASAAYTTVNVRSTAMVKDVPVSICLPGDYQTATTKTYPVAYLLHGSGNDNTTYAGDYAIAEYARTNGVIVVCPYGGKDWWMDSPRDATIKYETFVASELIAYVDGHYRTKANRQNRLIAGHSMGGHGAGLIGFRHKNLFSTVGIIMGGVDLTQDRGRADLVRLLGAYDDHAADWTQQSVVTEAAALADADFSGRIFVQIGAADELFLRPNRDLHALLTDRGVTHFYNEVANYRHDRAFALATILQIFNWSENVWESGPSDGSALAGALVIDASSEDVSYTDASAYAAAAKIVKTGAYKATLSFASNPSFSGEIEVREGTLAAVDNRRFGSPTRIVVLDGATFDMTGAAANNGDCGTINGAEFVLAGNGVNGQGALYSGKTAGNNNALKRMSLAADARVKFAAQIGVVGGTSQSPVELALNGHKLILDGSGMVFYAPHTQFVTGGEDDEGAIELTASTTLFPRYSAFARGTAKNRLILNANATVRLSQMNVPVNWSLVQKGDVIFSADRDAEASSVNLWAGPIYSDGGRLQFRAATADSFLVVSGNITNSNEGVYSAVMANTDNPGLVTFTGTNVVGLVQAYQNTRMAFAGGETTIHDLLNCSGSITINNAVVKTDYLDDSKAFTSGIQLQNPTTVPELVVADGGVLQGQRTQIGGSFRLQIGAQGDDVNGGTYGILDVREGAVVTNVNLFVGLKGYGAVYQTGGQLHDLFDNLNAVGRDANAYGYLGIAGGAFVHEQLETSSTLCFAGQNGTAVVAVKNGAQMSVPRSNAMIWGAYAGAKVVCYVANGGRLDLGGRMEFGDVSKRNHAVNGQLTVTGEGSEVQAADFVRALWENVGASWIVNLNAGGKLIAPCLYRTVSTYPWYLNCNGGVICPTQARTYSYSDSADRQPTKTILYENGLVIDTSRITEGTSLDFPFAFSRPETGRRVKAIALPTDPAFADDRYLGAPIVTISGAGVGASAVAVFDETTRMVTGIEVTSPGWGYADDSTTARISAGGSLNSYTCAVTLEDQPEGGWKGLVKRGAVQVNINKPADFRGDLTIEEGGLAWTAESAPHGGMPETAGIILKNNAVFRIGSGCLDKTVVTPFISGYGSFVNVNKVTVTDRIELSAEEVFAGHYLTTAGQVDCLPGVKVVVTDPESLVEYSKERSVVALTANGGLTTAGDMAVTLADGTPLLTWRAYVDQAGKFRFGYAKGFVLNFR